MQLHSWPVEDVEDTPSEPEDSPRMFMSQLPDDLFQTVKEKVRLTRSEKREGHREPRCGRSGGRAGSTSNWTSRIYSVEGAPRL